MSRVVKKRINFINQKKNLMEAVPQLKVPPSQVTRFYQVGKNWHQLKKKNINRMIK